MIEQLLHLPYAAYWLPLASAFSIAGGVYVFLVCGARRAAPVEAAVEATVLPPTAVDPFAQGSSGEQRVGYRRSGNPVAIHYRAESERGTPREGYVIDRSVGGLRLMVPEVFAVGTVLAIRPSAASDYVPEVQVEVMSCRASTTRVGEFDLGCQFVKSPTYAIILMFG